MAEAYGTLPSEILALDAETFHMNFEILGHAREFVREAAKQGNSLEERIRREREQLAREGLIDQVT